jgi:hypothetical protein
MKNTLQIAADLQCLLDGWGVINGGVQCSPHKSAFRAQYTCTQYPDLCAPFVVENYTVPLQIAYVTGHRSHATRYTRITPRHNPPLSTLTNCINYFLTRVNIKSMASRIKTMLPPVAEQVQGPEHHEADTNERRLFP